MKFDASWTDWVQLNVERDCDQKEMLEILVKEGFDRNESAEMLTRFDTQHKKVKANSTTPPTVGELFLPTARKIETDKAELYVVDNFLTEEECMKLVQLIKADLRPSTTIGKEPLISPYRTSKTCDLAESNNPFVQKIDTQICRFMGLDPAGSEGIQGQWYEPGEQFKPHTDYFEADSSGYQDHVAERGQRSWTFMIYLNSTNQGGSTLFTELDVEFHPIAGTAVIWNNRHPNGDLNPNTIHHGMPVKHGYKAIITKWFRSKTDDVSYLKEENEYIPPLTRNGFLKSTIPPKLFSQITEFYKEHLSNREQESVPDVLRTTAEDKPPSELLELPDELKAKVHEVLQPDVEAWIGDYLEPTFVYGIRRYLRGSSLDVHRDRLKTHIASVILNIDQEVDVDWPLHIEDHHYRIHNIVLKPGEMIFYEGARLAHGRPEVFKGDFFSNVFVHYQPKGA